MQATPLIPDSTACPPLEHGIFHRTALLLGSRRMRVIADARGLIIGLGGVGSWCAESLVRTGVRHLTIMDSDRVCITNINRQIQATCSTIGQVKTEALRNRLLDINPQADIVSVQRIYDQDSAAGIPFDDYDFIVDAIDSVSAKALLLATASRSRAQVFSSLGAASKLDPTRVRVAELWDVKGCPLGAALRRQMRRQQLLTAKPIPTVYSDEVLANAGESHSCGTSQCLCPHTDAGPGDPELLNHEWCSRKAVINGSVAHITGIFGLTLAGLVIQGLGSGCDAE